MTLAWSSSYYSFVQVRFGRAGQPRGVPLQPEQVVRRLLGHGLLLHPDARNDLRVRPDLLRDCQATRPHVRDRGPQGE